MNTYQFETNEPITKSGTYLLHLNDENEKYRVVEVNGNRYYDDYPNNSSPYPLEFIDHNFDYDILGWILLEEGNNND